MTDHKPIRVVLIEDDELTRLGLHMQIAKDPSLEVAGEAANRSDALKVVREGQPDIVLLDVNLGGESGLEFLPELLAAAPAARVLLMFEKQNAALLCAEQIQKGVERIAPGLCHKIAIDYGDLWRITRAQGYDYCGKVVTRCRALFRKTKRGAVRMTNEYASTLGQKDLAKIAPTREPFSFDHNDIRVWKLPI